jgi:predicted Zn finger-like uncharacterized protein
MSFRITQCPACESTFQVTARILDSAGGKVRCGACLSVFAANDNLLEQDEELLDSPESVFVSSNPDEFFNPSIFLTRQALQEAVQEAQQHRVEASQSAPETDIGSDSCDDAERLDPISEQAASLSNEIAAPAQAPTQDSPPVEEPNLEGAPDAELGSQLESSSGRELESELENKAESEQAFFAAVDAAANESEPAASDSIAAPREPAEVEQSDSFPTAEHADSAVSSESIAITESIESNESQESSAEIDPTKVESSTLSADPLEPAQNSSPEIEEPPPFEEDSDQSDAETNTARTQAAPFSPYSPHLPPPPQSADKTPEAFRLHASFSVQTAPYSRPPAAQPSATADEDNSPPASDLQDDSEAFNAALESGLTESRHDSDDLISVSDDEALEESLRAADDLDWTLADEEDDTADDSLSGQLDTEESAKPGYEESQDRPETNTEAPAQSPSEELSTEDASAPTDEAAESEESDQSIAAIRARALQHELEDDEALEHIPKENLLALGKFSSPVEIIAGQPKSLRRQLTWTVLALFAGMLLAGQYLWREMDLYSQNTTIRPAYEFACQWLDCDLPVYNDLQAISATSLAVRSHPDEANALRVNIEFQNFAPFAQRFPVLVLSFNAADNSVIALREFAAAEYLPEQLRDRSLMPAQTPLQVNLNIIDPGDDAVNYTLAFRNP